MSCSRRRWPYPDEPTSLAVLSPSGNDRPMTVPEPDATDYWDDRSGLDPLAAVLDPVASAGRKNSQIDRMHRLALRRALGGRRLGHVLDFGCGIGRMTSELSHCSDHVTGVDISADMIERARCLNPSPRVDFITYDGNTLPFPDGSFDAALSVVVLQLYRDQPSRFRAIVRELVRVLRPGASVWLVEQAGPTNEGEAWPPDRWRAELGAEGLVVTRLRPVRHFRHSMIFRATVAGLVPERWLEHAARLDLTLTARAGLLGPYTECLMSVSRP
jgi:SAM-dependent methyltransferase